MTELHKIPALRSKSAVYISALVWYMRIYTGSYIAIQKMGELVKQPHKYWIFTGN